MKKINWLIRGLIERFLWKKITAFHAATTIDRKMLVWELEKPGALNVVKSQLARRLAEDMLEKDMIDFQMKDEPGLMSATVSATVYVTK